MRWNAFLNFLGTKPFHWVSLDYLRVQLQRVCVRFIYVNRCKSPLIIFIWDRLLWCVTPFFLFCYLLVTTVFLTHHSEWILQSWHSFIDKKLIIITWLTSSELLALRLPLALWSLIQITLIMVIKLTHAFVFLTNLLIWAINLGLGLDRMRFFTQNILFRRNRSRLVTVWFHFLELVFDLILLKLDSLRFLLPDIFNVYLLFLD